MENNNSNNNNNNANNANNAEVKNKFNPEEGLSESEIERIRIEKLNNLKQSGKDPYQQVKFDRTMTALEVYESYSDEKAEQGEVIKVKTAGRLVSKRTMGKAAFAHILDGSGKIQIYLKIDNIGADAYEDFKKVDIGDIIGVTGEVFKTHKGEISINASEYILLSKSLLPLPEKYHGLKDNDLRYRHRYIDLIANPDVKECFYKRSKIITTIRRFLDDKNFLEVETPVLNTIAGGASARPFVTHHNTLNLDMYLRIAPELYLKRLIVGGFDKVYELGRMFRNEGMDASHNPEFTMMELYEAYADFNDMMQLTEDIYTAVRNALNLPEVINYQGTDINLKTPFARLTMKQAVKKYTGLDFDALNRDDALAAAKKIGVEIDKKDIATISLDKLLYEVFDQKVEGQLIDPVFITEYPVEISPLAKRIKGNETFTYRFELFINAREMGNAYSELNDPIDQKERFLAQEKLKAGGDDEAQDNDDDFVRALKYGLPPTGGLGLGIDRMVMLFTDSATIRDVLLFPTMKPKN